MLYWFVTTMVPPTRATKLLPIVAYSNWLLQSTTINLAKVYLDHRWVQVLFTFILQFGDLHIYSFVRELKIEMISQTTKEEESMDILLSV